MVTRAAWSSSFGLDWVRLSKIEDKLVSMSWRSVGLRERRMNKGPTPSSSYARQSSISSAAKS